MDACYTCPDVLVTYGPKTASVPKHVLQVQFAATFKDPNSHLKFAFLIVHKKNIFSLPAILKQMSHFQRYLFLALQLFFILLMLLIVNCL